MALIIDACSVKFSEVNEMLAQGWSFTQILEELYPDWAARHKKQQTKEIRSAAEQAAIQLKRAQRKAEAKERKQAGAARKAKTATKSQAKAAAPATAPKWPAS